MKRTLKDNSASDDETKQDICFPPEKLYEYQWPQGDPSADFFFLQEHVAEYLDINGVRSFQRKYPDMDRRILSMEEREYLLDEGVITEEQSTLGLASLRSDDVCQLMMEEYPAHHQRYLKVFHTREMERAIQQKAKEREDVVSSSSTEMKTVGQDSVRVRQAWKRAHRQVAEFNARINRERREERRCFYDLQTNILQYPPNRVAAPQEIAKVGLHPVALFPGQFQDYFDRYTPQQLAMFPLNTPTVPPPAFIKPMINPPSAQIPSFLKQSRVGLRTTRNKLNQRRSVGHFGTSAKHRCRPEKVKSNELVEPCSLCGICLEGKDKNKLGVPEELISCHSCGNSGHPTCLDMSEELVAAVKTYAWQCIECKTCMLCNDPHDEDKMLFCDKCDRGYHTFCVGLDGLPSGYWICSRCPMKSE